MLSARLSGVCLVAFGLTGCATYTFIGSDYDYFAYHWAATHACSKYGHIDADTAATGIQIMNKRFSTANLDRSELNRAITKSGEQSISIEGCRAVAVNIRSWQKELGQQAAANRELQEAGRAFTNSMPKQTICNRIGTQTFCSTY